MEKNESNDSKLYQKMGEELRTEVKIFVAKNSKKYPSMKDFVESAVRAKLEQERIEE